MAEDEAGRGSSTVATPSMRLSRFERYARSVVAHRVKIVAAVLAITAGLGTQLGSLHLEIRRRANLPGSHPYVQIQNRISDVFGGEAIVILGVIAREGDIFTPAMLGKIQRITDRLRASPNLIEPSLFSLAGPYVRTVLFDPGGAVRVDPLMDAGPPSAEVAARVRERVQADALFRETLVSPDQRAAMIVADFDDRIKDVELAAFIEQAVDAGARRHGDDRARRRADPARGAGALHGDDGLPVPAGGGDHRPRPLRGLPHRRRRCCCPWSPRC